MRKKADISQVFIYIFGIVLISLLLIFGVKSVYNLMKKSKQVSTIQFETQLKSDIEILASDYGSVKIKEYSVPGDYNEVCFINLTTPLSSLGSDEVILLNVYPVIHNSWSTGVEKNVFFVKDTTEKSIFIGKNYTNPYFVIDKIPYYLCRPVSNGKIKIKMEGMGDLTKLSEP